MFLPLCALPSIPMSHRWLQSMEDKCPVCDTDRYLKPHLRLLVSPCYHRLCAALFLPSLMSLNHPLLAARVA